MRRLKSCVRLFGNSNYYGMKRLRNATRHCGICWIDGCVNLLWASHCLFPIVFPLFTISDGTDDRHSIEIFYLPLRPRLLQSLPDQVFACPLHLTTSYRPPLRKFQGNNDRHISSTESTHEIVNARKNFRQKMREKNCP